MPIRFQLFQAIQFALDCLLPLSLPGFLQWNVVELFYWHRKWKSLFIVIYQNDNIVVSWLMTVNLLHQLNSVDIPWEGIPLTTSHDFFDEIQPRPFVVFYLPRKTSTNNAEWVNVLHHLSRSFLNSVWLWSTAERPISLTLLFRVTSNTFSWLNYSSLCNIKW